MSRSPKTFFALVVGLLLLANTVHAQLDLGDFQLAPGLEQFANSADSPGVKVDSQVMMWEGTDIGLLTIHLKMKPGWKLYSLTQASGGPTPSKIILQASQDFRLLGSFAPDRPPKVEWSEAFEMQIESFEDEVRWSVPIQVITNSNDWAISGYVDGLACAGQCVPLQEAETKFSAKATSSMPNLLRRERIDGTHADILVWLSADQAVAGEALQVHFAFVPEADWHVYAHADFPASMFEKPTLLHAQLPASWERGKVRSSAPVISKKALVDGDPPIREYLGPATVSLPVKIPTNSAPGEYKVRGHLAFQTCSKAMCDRPIAVDWHVDLQVTAGPNPARLPRAVALGPTRGYTDVVSLVAPKVRGDNSQDDDQPRSNQVPPGSPHSNSRSSAPTNERSNASTGNFDILGVEYSKQSPQTGLGAALLYAFAGGFVLNFMPCVLPVIGLKVLSFVEQAGTSRAKAFRLNLSYVLGMLTIFWVLAALAAAPALGLSEKSLGWGEQYNSQAFSISLVAVIFVMALSFLGVWEIPIPGFAAGNTATNLSARSGWSGAFFKGGITTLLATPCSAPGIITAYAFAVNSRDPILPFLIFTVMGLGMGVPYLLLGAFPSLVNRLPKPGAWMDTFKQLMGFVLLGTVLFLMQNVAFANLLPTMGLLFGLWFACWWIGRVPMTASKSQQRRAWAIAAIIGLMATTISFSDQGLWGRADEKLSLAMDRAVSERLERMEVSVAKQDHQLRGDEGLPWEPFQRDNLNAMIQNGETVMIDFTADWCQTCRWLESYVLDTEPVRSTVQQQKVRTVIADWGTQDPEIGALLDQLQGSRQIPFLAIFPAGNPQNVIRFSGPYSQATILAALQQAASSSQDRPASTPAVADRRVTRVSGQLQ